MALSLNTVWEVQTGGNDTNGGGFVTGASGTDYSLVAGKRTGGDVTDISTTDGVANGTTTFTSATANFQTSIIGNIIYLQGGTGGIAAVRRQVTARASTTSITIDASVAASTGMTLNIGGALLSPGIASLFATILGMYVYIKAGTYAITSASTNVAGGCVSSTAGVGWEGYQTTRGDLGTAPLLQASGISSFTLIGGTQVRCSYRNLNVDGAGLTTSRGWGVSGLVYKCGALNCTNSGFGDNSTTTTTYIRCFATGCSSVAAFLMDNAGFGNMIECIAYNNTVTGFSMELGHLCLRCISDSNSGASSDGFILIDYSNSLYECVAYGNGRDGFRIEDGANHLQNCLSEDNAGWSYIITGSSAINSQLVNCAGFTNGGSGETSIANTAGNRNHNYVTGTSTFFTNAAGQDFSLNNTAGGGADVRGNGYPGTLDTGGTGYIDRGALQNHDTLAPTSNETAYGFIG